MRCRRRSSVETSGESQPQLHELPAVLVVNVFSYLETRCIVRAGSAHRYLHAVVSRNSFWGGIYALRWRRADEKQGFERVRAFATKYALRDVEMRCQPSGNETPGSKRKSVEAIANEAIDWCALYRERHVVERNWVNGKALITTLNGHSGTVTCLQFDDSRLVRGACWGGCCLTRRFRLTSVSLVHVHEQVSGSDDGSMMLWSLQPPDEGECAIQALTVSNR